VLLNIPVIQLALGSDALEFSRVVLDPRPGQEIGNDRQIILAHRLDLRIGTQRFDIAAHIQNGFIQRIAQCVACIAAYHHAAGLRHESGKAADRTAHHDVAALQRNTAAQARIAVDDQQSAVGRGTRAVRCESFHMHFAAHHVLADAGTGATGNGDGGRLVHAARVVTRVALHFNLDRAIQTHGDVVRAVRIEHCHFADLAVFGFLVQELVELAQRTFGQIKIQIFHTYISSGAGSNT
jgi:hypothetical protein